MEITVGLFLLLFCLAFFAEFVDSSLGMGYGTLLSPLLVILGFDPVIAIPAILLSQAFGGLTASIFHHQFRNVSFRPTSRDLRVVLVISGFGIVATVIASLISINLPTIVLKTYIGLLVLSLGLVLLRNRRFRFSWNRIVVVGVVSAFNKGLSGGGFGPVVTAGQVLSGQDQRGAIGVTTLSEAPICISSFLSYLIGRTVLEYDRPVLGVPLAEFFARMFSREMFPWELILALLLGSIFVAPFGAFTTRILRRERLHLILGALVTLLGAWTLIKTYF